MIHQGSRYRRKDAYTSRAPDRLAAPIEGVRPHVREPDEAVRLHTVIAGERIDHLAHRHYGDPLKYWLICDANDALFPEDLMVPGRVLKIPPNRLL